MWRRVIDCLGIPVGIESPLLELDAALGSVFGTYREASGPPRLEYVLEIADWPRLVRNGEVVGRHEVAIDLVPALELDLYAEVALRASGLLLHAGAIVGAGGAALVFAGPSGAGKSTLVRALLARGFSYLSEECVSLSEGGRCLGLARPLHADVDEVVILPGASCHDYLIRQGRDVVHKQLFHPPAPVVWHGPARTVAIVKIAHAPEATPNLEALSAGAALAALWPAVLRPDLDAIEAGAAALSAVARYRLHTAQTDQAIARALALAHELGVEPIR